MGAIKFQSVHTVIDKDGVMEEQVQTQIMRLPTEPPYVKLYLAEISRIHGLSASVTAVLLEMASRAGYDGIVGFAKRIKEVITAKTGIKRQTIDNAVATLVSKGIVIRLGRGEFELDPNIFAKGDWKDICQRRAHYKDRLKDIEMNFKIRISAAGKRSVKGTIAITPIQLSQD